MEIKIINNTILGNCSCCGECCSDFLHLDRREIRRIDAYLKKHKVPQHNKGENNFICPFRNNELKRCDIYKVRPDICRVFKCNRTPEEAIKIRDFTNSTKKVRSMASLFFDDHSKIGTIEKLLGARVYKRGE